MKCKDAISVYDIEFEPIGTEESATKATVTTENSISMSGLKKVVETANEPEMLDFPINPETAQKSHDFLKYAYPVLDGEISLAQALMIVKTLPFIINNINDGKGKFQQVDITTKFKRLADWINGEGYIDIARREDIRWSSVRESVIYLANRIGNTFVPNELVNVVDILAPGCVNETEHLLQASKDEDTRNMLTTNEIFELCKNARPVISLAKQQRDQLKTVLPETLDSLVATLQTITKSGSLENPEIKKIYQEIFGLVKYAVRPTQQRIMKGYRTSARLDMGDIEQLMDEELLAEFIPNFKQFNTTGTHFNGFYAASAWRGVQDYVGKNASPLSTQNHFYPRTRNTTYGEMAMDASSLDESITDTGRVDRDMYECVDSNNVTPERFAISAERLSILSKVFASFTPGEKSAVEGVYIDGRSYKEVALEMDIATSTLEKHINTARRKIRCALEDKGYNLD